MAKTRNSSKKTGKKRFAVVGLWIAGIALLTTIILTVVKLLAVSKIYTLPDVTVFNWILGGSAALIVLGLAVFALLDPQRVREFLTGRQARYGSNAAIMLVAFVGILLVINLFFLQNPGKPRDLTEDKQNSLTAETLDALESLPATVQATAFFTSQTPADTAQGLLENYKNFSNGNFEYTFIDPDQQPLVARQAGITGDGKIFLQMGDQHEIVAYASEQDITSALIRLMNPGRQVIYFLTGHGERDIQNAGDTALTIARTALEAKNYTVQQLNLIAENKIPDNASVIVIAGPQQPITSTEQTLLSDYVTSGKALVILEEPVPMSQSIDTQDPLVDYLSTTWGILLENNIVIDTNSNQPLYAIAANYGNQPITEKLQGLVSFFPTSRSLSLPDTSKATALISTTNSSWGETDFAGMESNGQVAYDEGVDFPGPLTLAASAEDTTVGSHVVVFGDSDFATNSFFDQYANGDLFINAIDWAAGQEQLINLTKPSSITRTLALPSSFWLLIMAVSLICILPGIVIGGGVAAWLLRRSKG